jgi:hypothetical protein
MHELILIKVSVLAFDVIIDRDAGTTAAAFAFCIHNILRTMRVHRRFNTNRFTDYLRNIKFLVSALISFLVIDFIFRLKKKKPFDNKLLSMPLVNSGILDMFTFIKILITIYSFYRFSSK